MSVVERVHELVEPLLAEEGLELFDVEISGGRVLIVVDRAGGVDLDALTVATRRISAAFDRQDPLPGGQYLLEVSSPGLERTLRTPAHFRRFLGAQVSVKTRPGSEGERRCRGVLGEADDDGFRVDDRRFTYADVERVQTIFEWGPSPRPAKSRQSKAAAPPEGGRRAAEHRLTHPTKDQKAPAS